MVYNMSDEMYHEIDISMMGYREMSEVAELLTAYSNNPDRRDITKIGFNMNSGNVFLLNDDYDCYMMNNGHLEQWFNCSYCGNEGFMEDIETEPNNHICSECGRDLETGDFPDDEGDDDE